MRRLGLSKTAIAFLFYAATAISSPAQTYKTLFNFDGTDGDDPSTSLAQGFDGNFYGTTSGAATENIGTAFKITSGGTLTTLHRFAGNRAGFGPSGLVQARDRYFYGTTMNGGAGLGCTHGCGMVFRIIAEGRFANLHSFDITDGAHPIGGLIQATDGNFYGTTSQGGASNGGTVFKITPKGALTTLYSFCTQKNCTDGGDPFAGLVQAADGNFYGTTTGGGANGRGTVFKITAAGELTTLYSFCALKNCADGTYSYGALVQGTDGNFYGTTPEGGTNCFDAGCGTVFKITPKGVLTTLYSFCMYTNCPDGYSPLAGLVQATDGNFYGTTNVGGAIYAGTAYKITATGKLTTLHSFGSDGDYPIGGLLQATNGALYGTTAGGGPNNDGTIFSLSVGLRPFVETNPTSGKVGAAIIILGTNLTGASSVSFNGTGAKFKVIRKSEITTTVPAGATTGIVEVTTPRGTLKSNVVFRVMK